MKKLKVVILSLCAGIVMAGCTNLAKGTAIGAGGGAVLGAIVGKMAGNTAVGAAIGTAVGAGTGALIGKHMDKVKKQAEAVQNAQVESIKDANGLDAVKLTFDSGILFATGKYALTASSKSALNQCATLLKNNADCDIAIYGHTDSTGSDAVNNPLSVNRAKAVQTYLLQQGVKAAQIRTCDGQGSTNPIADNSTAEGRQQNRRVEIYMYASQAMINAAEAGTLQ